MRTIHKPWGFEEIWAETDRYVSKLIHIKPGESLSLQYHNHKDETIYVLKGILLFEYFNAGQPSQSKHLGVGDTWHIPPLLRHRMTAFDPVEECVILEVSTPELEDVVRLEDKYNRI